MPEIRDIIYVPPQRDWQFPFHVHTDAAELSFLVAGKGYFYSMNRSWPVQEGMLIVKNAGLSHAERADAAEPMEQICISISGFRLEGLPEHYIIPDGMSPVIEMPGVQRELVRAGFLYLNRYGRDAAQYVVAEQIVQVVLSMIQIYAASAASGQIGENRKGECLIQEVTAYLDQHYREKISLKGLAGMFYVSEGHLSRQFKAHTGFTVHQYVLSRRMGEAQRLLLFEKYDIKAVAAMCGYRDLQYFYHVFRQSAGCTPAEYRRRYEVPGKG